MLDATADDCELFTRHLTMRAIETIVGCLIFVCSLRVVHAENGTEFCMVAVDGNNCVQMVNLTMDATEGETTKLACMPSDVTSAFTWSAALDAMNQIVYTLGEYPPSSGTRSVVAMQYQSGKVLSRAVLGQGCSGQTGMLCPYYLAVDPDTQMVYGIWFHSGNPGTENRIVRVNVKTGVSTFLANVTIENDTQCYAGASDDEDGRFDAFRGAYVMIYNCLKYSYLMRYYVETNKIAITRLKSTTKNLNYNIDDFQVDRISGTTYLSYSHYSEYPPHIYDMYLLGGTDGHAQFNLLHHGELEGALTLIALPSGTGACMFVAFASNPTTLITCWMASNSSWTTYYPSLNVGFVPLLECATVVPCESAKSWQ